jgi:hypothetical protein
MLGNPTISSGPFYQAFTRERKSWVRFNVSAFSSPNFEKWRTVNQLLRADPTELVDVPRPYLVQPSWVLEKYHAWTPESPLWQTRIAAEFAEQSEDSLISLAWIDKASRDEGRVSAKDPWVAGLDIAGPGESETVLTVRHGAKIEAIESWSIPDPRRQVINRLHEWNAKAGGDLKIYADMIAVGHYFVEDIKAEGLDVIGVNVGLAPTGELEEAGKYANLKAQLYWHLREIFQAEAVFNLRDDVAQSQLTSIRYKLTPQGKIQIESKEDARRRGVHSPDRAESIMLAFAQFAPANTSPIKYALNLGTALLGGGASSGWNRPDEGKIVDRKIVLPNLFGFNHR